MTEAAALSSYSPAAQKAATKQSVNAADDRKHDSFADVLDKTANADSKSAQPAPADKNTATGTGTPTSQTAETAETAETADQAAGNTGNVIENEVEAAGAKAATDPNLILAGLTPPTVATPTVGGLGLPEAGVSTEAEGSIVAPDGTLIVPQLAMGATAAPAPGAPAASGNTGAIAPASVPVTPAPQAETAAAQVADMETPQAETASTQSTNSGDTPSKASASTTQASAASASSANTQAVSGTSTAPQADISVDPASVGSQKAAAEAVAVATTTTQDAARTSTTNTPAQAAAPAATVQVYTRMIERFDGRAQRFEVRLDPAELGRVDVRIEVGADKKVHAVLAAHDSAALTDLMRGHKALERALTDAGFDLADGGVKFELASDSSQNASTGDRDARAQPSPNVWRSFNSIDLPAEAASSQAATPWRRVRLDLVA